MIAKRPAASLHASVPQDACEDACIRRRGPKLRTLVSDRAERKRAQKLRQGYSVTLEAGRRRTVTTSGTVVHIHTGFQCAGCGYATDPILLGGFCCVNCAKRLHAEHVRFPDRPFSDAPADFVHNPNCKQSPAAKGAIRAAPMMPPLSEQAALDFDDFLPQDAAPSSSESSPSFSSTSSDDPAP